MRKASGSHRIRSNARAIVLVGFLVLLGASLAEAPPDKNITPVDGGASDEAEQLPP
jgi:hypothetical protein